MQVLKAGTIYFLVAFGAVFVLEIIRLQVVALHVGERLAQMLEIPNVLLATMIGARWVVDRFTFTSPDEVGNLEDGVFMAANFLALLMGWWLGWVLGARWVEPGETHS